MMLWNRRRENPLKACAAYVLAHYPEPYDLTITLLTKILYKADWDAALSLGHALTGLVWSTHRYGPYAPAIYDLIQDDGDFATLHEVSPFGYPRERPILTTQGAGVPDGAVFLDRAMQDAHDLGFNGFHLKILETYPLHHAKVGDSLNLDEIAKKVSRAQSSE